ncbi:MAG TPA: APC family permease [Ktedonobacteraceae bacterium]|nr:APC family permease [Ktedonobacteraceae bacterium]
MSSPVTLRRVLKFRTVVSTSTGLAYAAISFLGCVQLAYYLAGDSAWIAILISGLLAVLAALCFSELNALYPTAAAIRLYMKEAFNDNFSLVITFGYLLTVVAAIAADSYIVGQAITYTLGLPNWASLIWILALLGLAMGANLRGIKIAGWLQDITTYALLAIAIIVSLIALGEHHFALRTPFAALGDPFNLLNAVAVGVFVFSAFEWVTPLSEEISDIRLIPRGMFIALGLLFISYALFTVAASSTLNVHSAAVANSAVPQLLLSQAILGQAGLWIMLIATLLTAVMTFNGGFATASRFLYAAAREDTLPAAFARISIARAVPYVAVISLTVLSAAIGVLIFATGQFQILILVGAVLEGLIYTIAGLCVIRLRRRQPDAARSFRIAGGLIIPVATIVIFGILAILASLITGSSGLMTGTPLIVTLVIFALSTLYVYLGVPRIRAAAAARRATTRRRRPGKQPAQQEEIINE